VKKYILIAFVLGIFAGVGGGAFLLRTVVLEGDFFGISRIDRNVVTTKSLVLVQENEICQLPVGTILTAESADDITRLSISIGIDNAFVYGDGGVFEYLPVENERSSFSHLYPVSD